MSKNMMNLAVQEAKKASNLGEVPVGAVIVYNNEVIAKAHNLRNTTNSVLGHAEIIAIDMASKYLNDWRLDDCEMYVTLEPCEMCKAVIDSSRIKRVYYCIDQTKNPINAAIYEKLNPVDNQIKEIMDDFFENIRNNK